MSRLQLSGHKLMWHMEDLLKWQKGGDISPLHLDISPSSACNQNCRFCYVGYLGRKEAAFLEEGVFLKLMKDLGSMGVKSAAICGTGEPLLNKATPEAITTGKKSGLDISLITNGVFFTSEKAEKTLGDLTWIRFSVYGASKKVYDFVHRGGNEDWEKVNANIKKAVEIKQRNGYKTTIGAVMLVLPENGREIADLARKCREYGFDYLAIKPASQNPKNELDIPRDLDEKFSDEIKEAEGYSSSDFHVVVRRDLFEFERSLAGLKDRRVAKSYKKCLGLPFISCIDADGNVYACNGFWRSKKFLYGSLYEKSFNEIWEGPLRKEVMAFVQNELDLAECEPFCRHNSINTFLWNLYNPPSHINFV